MIARPYTLYLTAGMHELTLVAGGVPFALEKIELRAPEKPEAYIDKAAGYDPAPTGGQVKPVVIQGENAAIKIDAFVGSKIGQRYGQPDTGQPAPF